MRISGMSFRNGNAVSGDGMESVEGVELIVGRGFEF